MKKDSIVSVNSIASEYKKLQLTINDLTSLVTYITKQPNKQSILKTDISQLARDPFTAVFKRNPRPAAALKALSVFSIFLNGVDANSYLFKGKFANNESIEIKIEKYTADNKYVGIKVAIVFMLLKIKAMVTQMNQPVVYEKAIETPQVQDPEDVMDLLLKKKRPRLGQLLNVAR